MLSPGDWDRASASGASAELTHASHAPEPFRVRHEGGLVEPRDAHHRVHGRDRLVAVQQPAEVAGRPQRRRDSQAVYLDHVTGAEGPLTAAGRLVAKSVSGS